MKTTLKSKIHLGLGAWLIGVSLIPPHQLIDVAPAALGALFLIDWHHGRRVTR